MSPKVSEQSARFLTVKPITTDQLRSELCRIAGLACDGSEKHDNGYLLATLEAKLIQADHFQNAVFKSVDELKAKGLYL